MKKAVVIIVSHNNKEIIAKTLDGWKSQTYKDFEVYLADDSTDGSEKFVKENYPWVNFMDLWKSVSAKRNIIISKTKSRYIVTFDSDAIPPKTWLEDAIKYMDNHENIGICCGKLIGKTGKIDFAGCSIAKSGGTVDMGYEREDGPEYQNFKRMSGMTTANAIIRREMVEKIGGFDEEFYYGYEDVELGLRANFAGFKVVYNPDLISLHGYHSTLSKFTKKKNSYFEFLIRRNRILMLLQSLELKTIILNSPWTIASLIYGLKSRPFPTLKAYLWILFHPVNIIRRRKNFFQLKKISDKELFDLIYAPKMSIIKKRSKLSNFFNKVTSKRIRNLIFFVTTRCNSRCRHCFYWKELNKTKDLTLEQIEQIISKFYDLDSVSLSGGEPFIREDISEVVRIIVKYTNVKAIDIPTNCLTDISAKFERILKENPLTNFSIFCSLDGLKEQHDYIRGIDGSFEKTVLMIKKLKELKKLYDNFKSISINTVITNRNIEVLPELVEFVKKLEVNSHAFDIIRGQHQGLLKVPTMEEIRKANLLRIQTAKYYNQKKPFLKRVFYNLKEKEISDIQMDVLNNKKWPFKCTAGTTDFVIESNGKARICELQPVVGNLLKQSPEEILKSAEAKQIFKKISCHNCDCTHICNLYSSSDYSMKDIFINKITNIFKKH